MATPQQTAGLIAAARGCETPSRRGSPDGCANATGANFVSCLFSFRFRNRISSGMPDLRTSGSLTSSIDRNYGPPPRRLAKRDGETVRMAWFYREGAFRTPRQRENRENPRRSPCRSAQFARCRPDAHRPEEGPGAAFGSPDFYFPKGPVITFVTFRPDPYPAGKPRALPADPRWAAYQFTREFFIFPGDRC